MLEKQIEKKVCDYAKANGFLAYKFTSPARAAVPDRLFVFEGRLFFIEFKASGGKPTPAQEREHAKLRAAGSIVFVVDNVEKGKFVIDMVGLGADLGKIYI